MLQLHNMSDPGHDSIHGSMQGSINPRLASRLPFDIVLRIISHIDSGTAEGRLMLAACARFSHGCRATAEDALYRYATLDVPRLTALLLDLLGHSTPSRQSRAKRLVGVIEHLTMWDGWDEPVAPVSLLWQAASQTPGIPLFPRVQKLAILSSPRKVSTLYPQPVHPRFRPPLSDMPPGILVFGEIDVCVTASQKVGLLSYLPIRHVISYTAHDIMIESIPEDLLTPDWDSWGSLRVYNRFPRCIPTEAHLLRELEAKARAQDLTPIHIINYGAKWKAYSLEALADVDYFNGSIYNSASPICPWKPSASNKIQLEWYDPDDPTCPSCVVCGKQCCEVLLPLTRRTTIRGSH